MYDMRKDSEREMLMRKIKELTFATVDLNLYLDIHPKCQQAVMDYNCFTEELTKVRRLYEAKYGPLTNFGHSPSQYPWAWINEPWPWESGE